MGAFVGYENNGTTFCIIRLSDRKLVPTRHAHFTAALLPVAAADSSKETSSSDSNAPFVMPLATPSPEPHPPQEIIGDVSTANGDL
ncbi:hypothetical protein PCANC_23074 [Puccinia coronata f. sp. avenae]|uniref:Uncharacterized protein n=1 Tax=Puccinia coronata f. sp. avenae TaxID=200324 RepID=A0A2N5U7D4_9BASI|nr:hypothetical protein PCANC_23074 [Puccinia coronata f. sp. avenae]